MNYRQADNLAESKKKTERVVLIILTGQFVPIKIIRTTLIVNYCAVKQ